MHTKIPVVDLVKVNKSFGSVKAVDDLSFTVNKGELFGLLGPNGAGKTTSIRLMLDILKPDIGEVFIFGEKLNEQIKQRIGYMPEERGLYQDIKLERVLIYLASLKGMEPAAARQQMLEYLDRFDLTNYRKKKVKELSRGMQQKAQVIATVLHQPELIIIDEPFIGLDPINTQLVKDLMLELKNNGTTIIMSTHQLNKVEELCNRLLFLNNGKAAFYGKLEDIQREYSGKTILVKTLNDLPMINGIQSTLIHNSMYRLELMHDIHPQEILWELLRQNVKVDKFEIETPGLEEIFIKVILGDNRKL